ncbi:hypothetical protein [Oceaniserpentilla sp. 4NH20-0058]|uniref:hypothetical protein n=1 Tax=Oceaniserpentilla sp. 4NH20-0058 TaxID=3127660 RepID=UPI0033413370
MSKNIKVPQEYLVWPPISAACGLFVFFVFLNVLPVYHSALLSQTDTNYLAGYLFPVFMGGGLAWPLHGRFWLGFAWLCLICCGFSYVFHFFALDGYSTSSFMVITSLALMFLVQALTLWVKRQFWHRASQC